MSEEFVRTRSWLESFFGTFFAEKKVHPAFAEKEKYME